MSSYKSSYTGQEVDEAVGKVLDDDGKVKYGNIIGNIEDQQDLIDALNAIKSVRLDLVMENGDLTLQLDGVIQTFNDVVDLIFGQPKLVYVKAPDCLLFPGIFDLEGNPAFIYFIGVRSIGTPGVKYLRFEDDDSVTPQDVYTETTTNKVTEITAQSTDANYPSAKAVYTLVSTTLGDINTALEEIIGDTPEEVFG